MHQTPIANVPLLSHNDNPMAKRKTKKPKTPTISDVLRRAIRTSGLPMLRIQKATGVHRVCLVRFVRGDQSLLLNKAEKLAEFFGLKLS